MSLGHKIKHKDQFASQSIYAEGRENKFQISNYNS